MAHERVGFERYRQLLDAQPEQGLEAMGLFDPAIYAAAVADPRTTSLIYRGRTVPLLIPIDLMPYQNDAFYRALPGVGDRPIMHYSEVPTIFAADPSRYRAALEPALRDLARKNGLLVYDFPINRSHVDERVEWLVASVGSIACHHIDQGELPKHYHYASPVRFKTGHQRVLTRPLDFYKLAAKAGAGPVSVESMLSDDDADFIWSIYGPAHETLNANDPITAGFTQPEMQAVLHDPAYVKLVHRDRSGVITSLSLVATVQDCPWLSASYFKQRYPLAYARRRIICGIGAIVNPNASKRYGPIVTLGKVSQLVAIAGGHAVYACATDEVSNLVVPSITQRSCESHGLDVDFRHPVGYQLFGVLQLRETES